MATSITPKSNGEASQHVVVIGGGIVGACSAFELLEAGCKVTLIDPEPAGSAQAASYGNGAWLSPSSVVPMSMPGLWKKIPGYLLDKSGPLQLRWSAIWPMRAWLWRFMRAGSSVAKVKHTAKALAAILHDAPERHAQIAKAIGRPELIRKQGLLYLYPDRAAFAAEALAWQLRAENGVAWEELEGKALQDFAPQLGKNSHYRFAVWVGAGGQCAEPAEYLRAIFAYNQAKGMRYLQASALGFETHNWRLSAVQTNQGSVACDAAVVAAGIASKALARAASDGVFLESERGYHVVFEEPGFELPCPMMPSDAKMANSSTLSGLRMSGQVELAPPGTPPNWQRAEILRQYSLNHFPQLAHNGHYNKPLVPSSSFLQASSADPNRAPVLMQLSGMRIWMGNRPSTPDGLPVIGPSRRTLGVFHAFGHGHVGLAAGAVTGKLVAQMLTGQHPDVPLEPYRINRF